MPDPTILHFVRHGEVSNPQRVFYGRLPGFSLNEEGCKQAQLAAEYLRDKPIAAIFSSPLERARETAEFVLAWHSDLSIQVCELLDEVYSPFDGYSLEDMKTCDFDIYTGVDQPYERPVDVLWRIQGFTARVRREYAGKQVVATTHGDLIAFFALWAQGMPITLEHRAKLYRDHLTPGSIATATFQTATEELPVFEFTRTDRQ